jgi:hypothetical protein
MAPFRAEEGLAPDVNWSLSAILDLGGLMSGRKLSDLASGTRASTTSSPFVHRIGIDLDSEWYSVLPWRCRGWPPSRFSAA